MSKIVEMKRHAAKPSIDQIVSAAEIVMNLDPIPKQIIGADHLSALIADWRKRGEALKPFAKHAEMMDREFADHGDDIIAAGVAEHPITFGDFRRALAALTRGGRLAID